MRKKILLFAGSLIGLLVLLFLDRPSLFGVCFPYQYGDGCIAPYNDISDAFFPILTAFSICFFVYLLVKKTIARYEKFSLWYGGISLVIIGFFIYQNEYNSGGFMFSSLNSPVPYSWLLSIIYVIVSLVIIGLAARKK